MYRYVSKLYSKRINLETDNDSVVNDIKLCLVIKYHFILVISSQIPIICYAEAYQNNTNCKNQTICFPLSFRTGHKQ